MIEQTDMQTKTSDYHFELPGHLIAQYPSAERGQSRLMVMRRKEGSLEHRMLRDLPSILESGTLMVFNNSRVRKARLYGVSETGGAECEFLLLSKILESGDGMPPGETGRLWKVLVKRARRRRQGSRYVFGNGKSSEKIGAEITGGDGEYRRLKFDRPIDDAWLDIHGHVPLPPYIRRNDLCEDAQRYQTVYAEEYGSAAAPTAGLHFTEELLGDLTKAGIETAFITLHVGLGTFLPVRAENIEEHRMHEETYSINEETASQIERARAGGRKVLAVGTTSVRTLESAWEEDPSMPGAGKLRRGEGSTSIFIYPPYRFKAIDAIFTNFHTPSSTLLMLVSAFAGRDFILESYKEAIREGYHFFSYGDACLLL